MWTYESNDGRPENGWLLKLDGETVGLIDDEDVIAEICRRMNEGTE